MWWLISVVNLSTSDLVSTNQLGTPVNFLDWIIWGGKAHPKSVHLLVAVHLKGHGRRRLSVLPGCPHSHWQVRLPCWWDIPTLDLELWDSKIERRTAALYDCGDSSTRLGLLWQPVSWTNNFRILGLLGNNYYWILGPQPVCHSNKSQIYKLHF